VLGAHRVKHLASMAARTRPLASCAPRRVGADLARAAPGVGPTASCAVEVATGCLIRCRVRMFTLPEELPGIVEQSHSGQTRHVVVDNMTHS